MGTGRETRAAREDRSTGVILRSLQRGELWERGAAHLGRRAHYRGGGYPISSLQRPFLGSDLAHVGGSALSSALERCAETHLPPLRTSLGQRAPRIVGGVACDYPGA